jgi:hypothetical protein
MHTLAFPRIIESIPGLSEAIGCHGACSAGRKVRPTHAFNKVDTARTVPSPMRQAPAARCTLGHHLHNLVPDCDAAFSPFEQPPFSRDPTVLRRHGAAAWDDRSRTPQRVADGLQYLAPGRPRRAGQ